MRAFLPSSASRSSGREDIRSGLFQLPSGRKTTGGRVPVPRTLPGDLYPVTEEECREHFRLSLGRTLMALGMVVLALGGALAAIATLNSL